MKDKGLAVMIGVGKPKGNPMNDMDQDVCFPVPEGLSVSDGETVELPTKYSVREGQMYPIEVAGNAIKAENEMSEESSEEEPETLEQKGDRFRRMAVEKDKQLGYES